MSFQNNAVLKKKPVIHLDATFTCTTYPVTVADKVQPFTVTAILIAVVSLRWTGHLCQTTETAQEFPEGQVKSSARGFQSDQTFLGLSKTNPIHDGITSQSTGLKGSATNNPVPVATGHLKAVSAP